MTLQTLVEDIESYIKSNNELNEAIFKKTPEMKKWQNDRFRMLQRDVQMLSKRYKASVSVSPDQSSANVIVVAAPDGGDAEDLAQS